MLGRGQIKHVPKIKFVWIQLMGKKGWQKSSFIYSKWYAN